MAHEKRYAVCEDMCLVPIKDVTDPLYLKRIEALEYATFKYEYPDVDNDGVISTTDVVYILTFSAQVAAGDYSNDKYGWKEYAADNDLNGNIYPDVNFDGVVDALDVPIVQTFISEAGAGKYRNDRAGWNEYMKELYPEPEPESGFNPLGKVTLIRYGVTGAAGKLEEVEE